jgi:hypothetical protein
MQYRILLGDVRSGTLLGELPLENLRYSHVLNAPGALSGTLPLSRKRTLDNGTIELARIAPIQTGRSSIFVERDGTLVWAGIIWTKQGNVEDNSLAIGAEGFHSIIRRRLLTTKKTYTAFLHDQAYIAKDLIDWTLTYGPLPNLSTANVTFTGVRRDRTWESYESKNIGEAIEQLAACEQGFNFLYHPYWDPASANEGHTHPLVDFLVQYPATGRPTNIVFELGGNVELGGYSEDATKMANKAWVTGEGDGPAMLRRSYSAGSALLNAYPLLEDLQAFPDVKENGTLDTKAKRRVALGQQPLLIPTIHATSETVPSFGSYRIGDRVTVRGDYGDLVLDGGYVITSVEAAVDNDGAEVIPITCAPVEVFDNMEAPDA